MTRKTFVIVERISSQIPPRKALRQPDGHGYERGDGGRDEADDERGARPVHELGEDVLAGVGRSEPVLATTARRTASGPVADGFPTR